MQKIYYKTACGVGNQSVKEEVFDRNHFAGLASYPAEVRAKIASWGLTRVAGNIFEARSTKDFWAVKDGKLLSLVIGKEEVDNHESIQAADEDNPQFSLRGFLDDLSFD